MKTQNKILSLIALLGGLALVLAGCGGSSSLRAPASFGGATISFNPTISFTTDTAFTYVNDAGDDSSLDFGGTADAPLTGTYTNAAGANAGQATLTLNFTDPAVNNGQALVLELSNFGGNQNAVNSFRVNVVGVGTFNARVTAGTLVPAPRPQGGGGGGGAGKTNATVPADWAGTYDLKFFRSDVPAPGGFPYAQDDTLTVTVTSGASGTLQFGSTTLTKPYYLDGNEFEILWDDSGSGLTYALSFSAINGDLNDLNVFTTAGRAYLGQFYLASSGENTPTAEGGFPSGLYTLEVQNVFINLGSPIYSDYPLGTVIEVTLSDDLSTATVAGRQYTLMAGFPTEGGSVLPYTTLTDDGDNVVGTLNMSYEISGETHTFTDASLNFSTPFAGNKTDMQTLFLGVR